MSILDERTFSTANSDGYTFELVDLTGVDMPRLVARAYDLSVPLGMGYLHFTPEPLTEEEVESLLADGTELPYILPKDYVLNLDYVKGRSVKLRVLRTDRVSFPVPEGCQMWMYADWFDHSREQLEDLLEFAMPVEA